MLDWKYITENCKNAFKVFYEWQLKDVNNRSNYYNDRLLYDFFDSKWMFIVITKDNAFGNEVHDGLGTIYFENKDWFDNRVEAENEAYIKAFELLEHKLTQQK